MRVGVLGATGVAGSAAAAELRSRGHEVVELRRPAVDVVTGAGLGDAFAGIEVLVECLNAKGTKPDVARPVLVDGVRAALAAAAEAGVGHAVSLSIVGCDRVPLGYYNVKVEQEGVVRAAPLPATVVRATQFHGLLDFALTSAARFGVIPTPPLVFQPIDPADVAVALADVVERGPGADTAIAGPEIVPLRALARAWKTSRGKRAPLLGIPAFGPVLKAIAAGGLTDPDVPTGKRTWAEYLGA